MFLPIYLLWSGFWLTTENIYAALTAISNQFHVAKFCCYVIFFVRY